ncbi:MAG: helix-turn-helix domain-containing protein [Planctomycetota bacterium JB042]
MTRRDLHLRHPHEIAAVTSPARAELIESFAAEDELSVAELAERLGRSLGSVYHHVKILLDVGVLREAGSRRRGRKDEALYALAARRITVGPSPDSPEGVEAARRAAAAIFRATGRELADALGQPDVRREGADREVFGLRGRARLTKTELRRVNAHVDAIVDILEEARRTRRRRGRHYAFLAALAPARGRRDDEME